MTGKKSPIHILALRLTRNTHSLLAFAVMAVLLCSNLPNTVQAADGDLDLTFSADGKVTTDLGASETASAVVVQPDGKIVIAGDRRTPSGPGDFVLVRYNLDGSLDSTFGSGGIDMVDIGGLDVAFGLALQPDGKLVVVGSTFSDATSENFAVARLNRDGSLDQSFGSGGKTITDFLGDFDEARGVALAPDGKIILGGFTRRETPDNTDFAVARYNTNGSLDTSFGVGGKVLTDFFGSEDEAFAVAVQADGKIVLAGGAVDNPRFLPNFALARYNTDGSLDSGFGSGGKLFSKFSLSDEAFAVAIQRDGKIVAGGHTFGGIPTGLDFCVARYNTNGSLDQGFGSGGFASTDFFRMQDQVRGLVIQPDGKIVAAGLAVVFSSEDSDFGLARYNTDGSPDASFGTGGKVNTDFFGRLEDSFESAFAVAQGPDGKLVAAGVATSPSGGFDFAVARYLNFQFDVCLSDDQTGSFFRFNSVTGDYIFTDCVSGFTLSGRGSLKVSPCLIQLDDNSGKPGKGGRIVHVVVHTCSNQANATIHSLLAQRINTYTLNDSNILNNTCRCR
jgi:uncharacterized delta-60 repeat protein